MKRQRTGEASLAQFAQNKSWWWDPSAGKPAEEELTSFPSLLLTGSMERGQPQHCSVGGGLGENGMLMSVLIGSDSRSRSRLCVCGGLSVGFVLFSFCTMNLCSGGGHGPVLTHCCLRRCRERRCRWNVFFREVQAAFGMVFFPPFSLSNPKLLQNRPCEPQAIPWLCRTSSGLQVQFLVNWMSFLDGIFQRKGLLSNFPMSFTPCSASDIRYVAIDQHK